MLRESFDSRFVENLSQCQIFFTGKDVTWYLKVDIAALNLSSQCLFLSESFFLNYPNSGSRNVTYR